MKTFDFELRIVWPKKEVIVPKSFQANNRKAAFKKAEKWMEICLAICGKDEEDNKYLDAEVKCVTPK